MKSSIDIHVTLATLDDMEFWEDNAEEAMDRFNALLHMLYDSADDDDLFDWVDQLLSTWDDERQEPR